MLDRIELRGLRIVGTHGVLPEERQRSQPFEVDLDIVADLSRASASDDLEDTVDYGAVAAAVAAVVSGPHAAPARAPGPAGRRRRAGHGRPTRPGGLGPGQQAPSPGAVRPGLFGRQHHPEPDLMPAWCRRRRG